MSQELVYIIITALNFSRLPDPTRVKDLHVKRVTGIQSAAQGT